MLSYTDKIQKLQILYTILIMICLCHLYFVRYVLNDTCTYTPREKRAKCPQYYLKSK